MVGLAVFALLAVGCQGQNVSAPTRQLLNVKEEAQPVSQEAAQAEAMAIPIFGAAKLTAAQQRLIKGLILRHRVETLTDKMKPVTQTLSRILSEEKVDSQKLREALAECQAIHNQVMLSHIPLMGAIRGILSPNQQLAVANALLASVDKPGVQAEVPATSEAQSLPAMGERLVLTPTQKVLFANLKDMSVLTGTLRRAIATFMVNGDDNALRQAILNDQERQVRLDAMAAALESLTAEQRQILLGSPLASVDTAPSGDKSAEKPAESSATSESEGSATPSAYQLSRHGGAGARRGGGHGGATVRRGGGYGGGYRGHGGQRGRIGHRGHGRHHRGNRGWGGYWGSGYWAGAGVDPFWWGTLPYVSSRYLFLGGMYYPFYINQGLYYPDLSSPYQRLGGQFMPVYQAVDAPTGLPTSIAPTQAVVVAAEE